jgi:hypothetical protein
VIRVITRHLVGDNVSRQVCRGMTHPDVATVLGTRCSTSRPSACTPPPPRDSLRPRMLIALVSCGFQNSSPPRQAEQPLTPRHWHSALRLQSAGRRSEAHEPAVMMTGRIQAALRHLAGVLLHAILQGSSPGRRRMPRSALQSPRSSASKRYRTPRPVSLSTTCA